VAKSTINTPDALKRLEDLTHLPQPPAYQAVVTARREIVNLSSDYPPPEINVWDAGDGRGVTIKLGPVSMVVWPSGRSMESQ
jgi:hypothetical protein